MISTVSVRAGKRAHKLKLSTRAQVRLEAEEGKPIGEIVQRLITGAGGVTLVASAWAAVLEDGAGVEREEAMAVLDALGGANAAAGHLAEVLAKAFPALAAPAEGDGDRDGAEAEGDASANPPPAPPKIPAA